MSLGTSCLGYCARTLVNTTAGTYSNCGSCAWGYREEQGVCQPCKRPIGSYDMMFLVFHALVPLFLHIRYVRKAKSSRTRIYEVAEHICILLENLLACISTIMVYPPYGSFRLYACHKNSIKDWYPQHYTPMIDYQKMMRCSYEVVFPLLSIPYTHCIFLMIYTILLRGMLYSLLLYKAHDGKPFYYALLSLPVIIVVHGLLSGVIYYTFPYIIFVCSLIAITAQLAVEGKRSIWGIIVRFSKSGSRLLVLLIAMIMLAFSLISLLSLNYFNFDVPPLNVNLETIKRNWMILLLVPLAPIIYILTLPFSHPSVAFLSR